MCFSANASFGASAVLLTAGIFALRKVNHPSRIIFAAIPLLFSVQQFAEGFVWLSLTNKNFEGVEKSASTFFLIFAQVVWPAMVPLSIYTLEKDVRRKKVLGILSIMGTLVAVYLGYCLKAYEANAVIVANHIHYSLNFPLAYSWWSGIFYFIPTVLPHFISGNKRIAWLGITITASYFFTKIFYDNYLISIWCFFAAVLSVQVLFILTKMNEPLAEGPPIALYPKGLPGA
jgi:hypothetical protein